MKPYHMRVSKRGASHIKNGLPNQDSVMMKEFSEGVWTIVATDGVSSCRYATEASHIVSAGIMKRLEEALDKEPADKFEKNPAKKDRYYEKLLWEIARGTKKELEETVANKGHDIKDYGTTLEIALYILGTVYVLHCGDGLILSVRNTGEIDMTDTLLHVGETAHSVIPFVCEKRWESKIYKNSIGMAVMTDGMYEAVSPIHIQGYGYAYDPSLLLPLLDMRAHGNRLFYRKYVNSFAQGKVSDEVSAKLISNLYQHMRRERSFIEETMLNIRRYEPCKNYVNGCSDDMSIGIIMFSLPDDYEQMSIPDYEYIARKDFEKCYPDIKLGET